MKSSKKNKPDGLYLARVDVGRTPKLTTTRRDLRVIAKNLKRTFKDHGKVIVVGYEGEQKGYIIIEVIQSNNKI